MKFKYLKIKDISKTQSWWTPSRAKAEFWWWDIIWLKSGELNDNQNVTKYTETITQAGIEWSSAKIFPKWTLVMAMYGATAWKLGILWVDAATNQAICSIQNHKWMFVEKYVYYFLLKEREKIIQDSFWWAQPNISKTYIDNLQIPLPPLVTQQKIVEKLDELSAVIKENQEKIRGQIVALDELWKSQLDEVFSNEEWENNTIEYISLGIQYWYTGKTIENGKYQYLRITDIQNDKVDWNTVPFVNVEDIEAKKYTLNKFDIVFARTWATVGKSYLIEEEVEDKLFASYLIRIVPNLKLVVPKFFKILFQSNNYWNQIYLM